MTTATEARPSLTEVPRRATVLPFHLVSMLEVADAEGLDRSSIQCAMAGGAPVSPAVITRAEKAGVTVVRAYSLSERPTSAQGDRHEPFSVPSTAIGMPSGGNAELDGAGRGHVNRAELAKLRSVG